MANTREGWFTVDKDGLKALRAGVNPIGIIHELVANSFDAEATEVDVLFTDLGRGKYSIQVTDNGTGFHNLAHAYTLFAESERRDKPEKSGRWNLGEKLVLALCEEAIIITTTGTVHFKADGKRVESKAQNTLEGSIFEGKFRLSHGQVDQMLKDMYQIIPPEGVKLTWAAKEPKMTPFPIHEYKEVAPARTIEVTLPSVIARTDAETGQQVLSPTRRKAKVDIYHSGGTARILELGIPVVEIDDRWTVNVHQKVPLTMDRTNVTPAFLRELRQAVAEAMVDYIDQEDAGSPWVTVAAQNPEASQALTAKVITERFGEKAVIFDPSDPEANNRAVAEGYAVVHGRNLPKEIWANVRRHEVLKPAGQVFPTHGAGSAAVEVISPREWQKTATIAIGRLRRISVHLSKGQCLFEIVKCPKTDKAAWYTPHKITFNISKLGWDFFIPARPDRLDGNVLDLFIHEYAHALEENHLSEAYYRACTKIGAEVSEVMYQIGLEGGW